MHTQMVYLRGMIFDPFENRRCRDVRNKLGHGIVKAIQTKDIRSVQPLIHLPPSDAPQDHIASYINHRINCLKKVFQNMKTHGLTPDNIFLIAGVLWNLELFFEVHEWLEKKWLTARGNSKKALQAMILAAVVYEQLEYARIVPAKKTAERAVQLFRQHQELIPVPFDPALFILKLTGPDPVAPKFIIPGQK